jgi:hypothetical protein
MGNFFLLSCFCGVFWSLRLRILLFGFLGLLILGVERVRLLFELILLSSVLLPVWLVFSVAFLSYAGFLIVLTFTRFLVIVGSFFLLSCFCGVFWSLRLRIFTVI